MKILKKMHWLICSILLVLSGIFFVACGENDYSRVSLTSDVSSVVMDVGEERNVTFTIQNYFNGMSGELNLSTLNSDNCIEYETGVSNNGVTNVTIKGIAGGSTTLRAVTVDGLKECNISVTVRQYSKGLDNNDEKLYVSGSTVFMPNSSNFVFDSDANERGLDYYFYGVTSLDDRPLTLDDVRNGEEFVNKFISVSLISQDGRNHLIFKDEAGNLFTIKEDTIDIYRNKFFEFVPVTLNDGGYEFTETPLNVNLGEKFTFIAKYVGSDEIYVQRDFYVLTNITNEPISYSYSYIRTNNTTTDPILNREIVLVPEKDDGIIGANHVDYKTARLEITIPSTSDLVKYTEYFDDAEMANIILLGTRKENDSTILIYQVSSKTTSKKSTNLNINFYYDGWQNVNDASVNYTESIPVVVEFEPSAISVNGERGEQSAQVYTFYNNYASDGYGWQEFNVQVSRNDSSYEYLIVEFEPTEVMVRYNGTTYTDGSFQITDLSKPLYIKGVSSNNTVNLNNVRLTLAFDVLEPNTLTYNIRYNIITGADRIYYTDDSYVSEGLYITYDPSKTIDCSVLYTRALFNSVSFEYNPKNNPNGIPDVDVVDLVGEIGIEKQAENYYLLKFKLKSKAIGNGTYTLTLDNGTSIDVVFRSIETLDTLSVVFDNANNYITSSESDENSTTISIINDQNFNRNVNLKVVANGNEYSSAIRSASTSKIGNGFTYLANVATAVALSVTTSENGEGSIILTLNGYTAENFKRDSTIKKYNITIISYSLIERINVDKIKDGKENKTASASYTYVYIGAENENAQTAIFDVKTRYEGFRFFNPNTNSFVNDTFTATSGKQYVYWTVSGASILKAGRPVSTMFYNPSTADNVYTIEGCGTFNTDTMTFTAFATAASNYQISLIANIRQPNKIYSYTVSISALTYTMVNSISLQEEVRELYFSANSSDINQELIIHSEPITATNSAISAIFIPGTVTREVEGEDGSINTVSIPVNIFGDYIEGHYENGVYVEGHYEGITLEKQTAGTYLLKLNCEKFAGSELSRSSDALEGVLIIAATDWLDGGGNVKPNYQTSGLRIEIKYENGTKNNPFHLENGNDVLDISKALNAYYEIATAIDMTGLSEALPLGHFTGSILGTNNFAKIYGLNINNTSCDDSGNYGLFSNVSGEITNVQFEGNINITNAKEGANIGLLTAVNNGVISNVGVTVDDTSNITLSGDANIGLIAGVNNGEILQDFLIYSQEEISVKDEDGNIVKDEFDNVLTEENPLFGLSSHILVYMGDYYLNITNVTTDFALKLGGIVGENNGILHRVDNDSLVLYGYGQYFAYANINVQMADGNLNAFDSADIGKNFVGGAVGYSSENSEIYASGYGDNYEKGKGIVVGGYVCGPQFVGGVVGSYNGKAYNHYENDSDYDGGYYGFGGVTARAFVRGYTSHAGVIAGQVKQGSLHTSGVPFAIQAVDDRRLGIEASMLIRYLATASADAVDNLNIIGFGAFTGNGYDILSDNNVFTYIKRSKVIKEDGKTLLASASRSEEYYGDYVEVSIDMNANSYIEYQKFFTFDEAEWSVSANDGFGLFAGEGTDNVFYAHYFEASSMVGLAGSEGITKAQSLLDKALNTVPASSNLYPIKASNGLIFSSVNSDIISFNESGTMNVNNIGLARISVSSILNTNESLSVYIKVVNYFNSDVGLSIIYPDTAEDSIPIDNDSSINLKGNKSVTHYVKPNYSYENIVTSAGVANLSNMKITLAPNTEIVAKVKAISFVSTDGSITTLPEGESSVSIVTNGQTVTYSKNMESLDGTYILDIKPVLNASIPTDSGSIIYTCDVNKALVGTKLVYTKGAESIGTKRYDSFAITSSKQGEDTIIIDSLSLENTPVYILYNDKGEAVQGTADWISSYLYDAYGEGNWLFDVNFVPQSDGVGEQRFGFSLSVNKNSGLFINRYDVNIYGNYRIEIYADSDYDKMISIPIYFENMSVYSISIDNYDNISYVETTSDFSTSSKKAFPGNTGLLILNVSPEDADYDYIEIVNTEVANQPGNGKATFNLVAKYLSSNDGKMFDESVISGSTIANGGLRLNLKDIVNIYDSKDEQGKALYEKYRGLIYINYLIGTSGAEDGGLAQFKVTAYKDNQPSTPSYITLNLNLNYYAYVTIDGKQELNESEQGIAYFYHTARGLKYKLNLDYYGFAFDSITITSSAPEIGDVVYENGSYYFNVTNREIDFSNYEHGYPVSLYVNAYQKEGELDRTFSSITRMIVLEYVVNYIYSSEDEFKDIVTGMDRGIVNVQIGNIKELDLDLSSIIEYDHTLSSVVSKVEMFMDSMALDGKWTVYTNLNDSGISTGQPISIENYNDKVHKKYDIDPQSNFDNLYLRVRGLNITPLITHNSLNNFYQFSYRGKYRINEFTGGFISATDDEIASTLYTQFKFNVYQSSSSENPVPIDNYEDFMNMQENVHYILMDDIVLENSFKPITAKVASFDGNGYTIYYNGLYNFEGNRFGLFESIRMGAVVKNVTIALSGNTILRTSSSDFYAGLLAGENEGNITNCYVYSESSEQDIFLTAECNMLDSASYLAGLVGQNMGNVTNSRSAINITSSFNVAGLVGVNSGNIASSYFKNGKLVCTTMYTHNIAGLVVANESSGNIITSYVSGQPNRERIYSTDTTHYITSASPEAGFAYSNIGTISDCYTNINMFGSSTMAGFVHNNGGNIKNCFSTSVLVDRVTSSAGFTMNGSHNDDIGTFENCYYFYNLEVNTSDKNYNNDELINSSLANVSFEGVSKLDYAGFSDERINATSSDTYLSENFAEYAYSVSTTTSAVWFYSSGNQNDNFNNTQFNSQRLELVAPNIIANSKRELVNSIRDELTGQITYIYIYAEDSAPLGSIKNPYLISDAESLERNMIEPSSVSGYNDKAYRLVSDIDYSEYNSLSQLYKLIYYGNFEGNGMAISQIDLVSTDKLTNAGLFGQIGRDTNNVGTVMNLNLEPVEVSFVNTNCVGALAGTLSYGNIYNVQVDSQNNLAVLGNNFVGGVIGRTINSFTMKNITSNVSAVAYYKPASSTVTDGSYSQSSSDLSKFSYAGGVVGFASGSGVLHKIYADAVSDVMASRVGVALGGFDKNVTVQYLYVTITSGLSIKSYDEGYAGLAVGEVKGILNHVQVKGSGTMESPFKMVPGVANAVGGVAGLLSGGTISNAYMNQAFRVGSINTGGTTIDNVNSVGGLVGLVDAGDAVLSNNIVNQNISAVTNNLGGIIGYVGSGLRINQVAVKATELSITGRLSNVYLGGFVGRLASGSAVITDSYTLTDLIVETFVYTQDIRANVGSFVGFGSVNSMSYCYSTGKIDVQIEDKRSVNAVAQILQDEDHEADENIRYSRSGVQVDNVYYYGYNDSGVGNTIKPVLKESFVDMISFRSKVDKANAEFNERVYGTASFAKLNDLAMNHIEGEEDYIESERNRLSRLLGSKNAIYEIIRFKSEGGNMTPWFERMSGQGENAVMDNVWSLNRMSLITYLTMEDSFLWLK